jgi:hypothetical protein
MPFIRNQMPFTANQIPFTGEGGQGGDLCGLGGGEEVLRAEGPREAPHRDRRHLPPSAAAQRAARGARGSVGRGLAGWAVREGEG